LGLSIPATATELHLQRLLGVWAAGVAAGSPKSVVASDLRLLSDEASAFDWRDYSGDSLLALMVCAALADHDLEHPSLRAFATVCSRALVAFPEGPTAELALACDLLRQSGLNAPEAQSEAIVLPATETLLALTPAELIELCSKLARRSSCGRRTIVASGAEAVLPSLATSCACDWDIGATCWLLRACTYLDCHDQRAFWWAVEWVLDQETHGRFGLLAPEARALGTDPYDWHLYMSPTIGALWTLAEIRRPGFMLS
jgi:hypothetical protein